MSDKKLYKIHIYGYNLYGEYLTRTFDSDRSVHVCWDGRGGFETYERADDHPIYVECYTLRDDERRSMYFHPTGDTHVFLDEFDELVSSDEPPEQEYDSDTPIRISILKHITEIGKNIEDFEKYGWDDYDEFVEGNKEIIRDFTSSYLRMVNGMIENIENIHIDGSNTIPQGIAFTSDEDLIIIPQKSNNDSDDSY